MLRQRKDLKWNAEVETLTQRQIFYQRLHLSVFGWFRNANLKTNGYITRQITLMLF